MHSFTQAFAFRRSIRSATSPTYPELGVQEGRVAEMGSHVELLGRGGLYAQMWARQAEAGSDSRPSSSTNLAGLEEAVSQAGARVPQRRGGPAGDPPLARHGHGGHGFHG